MFEMSHFQLNWAAVFLFGNDVYIGSNGIIYTKYTQNPHTIEPPFNIATQSASLDRYSLRKSPGTKWPYCNNPCPAARQIIISILLVLSQRGTLKISILFVKITL